MTEWGPSTYTNGLGEVIRGYRLYLGLSRPAMAHKIGMATRTYELMEAGRRPCPPGFLDAMHLLADEFDNEVEALISSGKTNVLVRRGEDNEWDRSVAARAAIDTTTVLPKLVT